MLMGRYTQSCAPFLKAKRKRVKEMDNARHYIWDILTYATPNEFIEVLEELGNKYAYIYHNKDKNEDGSEKEPHTHILLSLVQSKTFAALKAYFERCSSQNTRLIPITRSYIVDRYEYLTHKNNPEKYQYKDEEIVSNDIEYYKKQVSRGFIGTDENEEFIADLLAPDINIRLMAIKYGRDFIRYYDKYMKFRSMVKDEDTSAKQRNKKHFDFT